MKTLLVFAFAACAAPQVGTTCITGDAWCRDPKTVLSCRAGVVTAIGCPGPRGCAKDAQSKVGCDQTSGAQPASFCLAEYEGTAQCGPDGVSYLLCTQSAWRQVACLPSQKCADTDAGVICK